MVTVYVFLFEVAVLAVLYALGRRRYTPIAADSKKEMKLSALGPISMYIIETLRLAERMPELIAKVQFTLAGLYGRKQAMFRTKLFLTDLMSLCLLVVVLATLAGYAAGDDPYFILYGVAIAIMLPPLQYKELQNKLARKKRDMLIELPEILNRITLLLGAGETLQRAIIRCVEARRDSLDSPLMQELALMSRELQMNASFGKSLEDFSKRCGLQEISVFTTTVLLHYKRGGDDLMLALKELSAALWDKRKSVARTLGEEAASKMVFPMVLIFFVVMVVVGAPALFMMGSP
ncbi:type II secretion system F family protein [Paenibacillus thalictri]|uniref:Type II secretion system protein n=1 Tax=Paenibacillus thalictri TaxID=2527873 RepID=A0A4Q9DVE3_9BACL|nr:type II secretion system F family protein [Paenibacillus thalictri]TBL80244.1 type II secretion system protein [Paenibacillus thalictri]